MTVRNKDVAVLGGGIMGCSLALFLAKAGANVTLIEQSDRLFSGASRWSEGKLHLGFLYAADTTFATAERLIPGALAFKPLVEDLLGSSIDPGCVTEDEIFLVHRASITDLETTLRYSKRLSERVNTYPDADRYCSNLSRARVWQLSPLEISRVTASPLIVGGFRAPERSVRTGWIADRYVAAVHAEPSIRTMLNSRIMSTRAEEALTGKWIVEVQPQQSMSFDFVIDALWNGKLAIDRAAGLEPEGEWSHRYRLSLFLRTLTPVSTPSAIIITGPFGEIRNYNGSDFYLSWYPAGLVQETENVDDPLDPELTDEFRAKVTEQIIGTLTEYFPCVPSVVQHTKSVALEGGWVFAMATGRLDDPTASIHTRDRFGLRRHGSYLSIDTGKYSTAPWLAKMTVDLLSDG